MTQFPFFRSVRRFQVSYTLLLVILCKSAISIVQAGYAFEMIRTWALSSPSSETKRYATFCCLITCFFSSCVSFQIEGFKLHVSHVVKPFTNRVRNTPDAASRPERLEKDLGNVRTLAMQLEMEAAKLRVMKRSQLNMKPKVNGEAKPEEDAIMAPPEETVEEEDPEPRECGSEAVERRVEKIMVDLREQGLVDVNNEREYIEKKVDLFSFSFL